MPPLFASLYASFFIKMSVLIKYQRPKTYKTYERYERFHYHIITGTSHSPHTFPRVANILELVEQKSLKVEVGNVEVVLEVETDDI